MSLNIEQIKKILKENPRDAVQLRLLGFNLLLTGNYKAARDQYRLAVLYDPHLRAKIILDYEKLLENSRDSQEIIISLGEFYLSLGDTQNAIFEFETALDLNEKNAELYNALGKIYLNQGQTDKVISLLERALNHQVQDLALTEMLAGAYLAHGYNVEAIRLYKEVLSFDPANKKIIRTLGELHLRSHQFDAAADYFFAMFSNDPEVAREIILHLSDLVERAPASIKAKEYLADIYVRSMQPDLAIGIFEKILELDANKLEDAIALSKRILKSYPSHQATQNFLAGCLVLKGEYSAAAAEYNNLSRLLPAGLEQAMEGFRKIIAVCPNQLLAHQYLAEAYLKQGLVKEAILEFEAAIQQSPEMVDEVIVKCKEILKSQPDFLPARRVLAQASVAAGDFRKAVSSAEELIAIDKNFAPAYCILAEAYSGQKLSRKARDAVLTALNLDPNNPRIHALYKTIREKEMGLEVEANLSRLAEDPWKIALHLDLGKLYYNLGKWDQAVDEFQVAAKDRSRAPFAYNLLGCVHRLSGRFDQAQRSFEKGLEALLPELVELKKTLQFNLGTTFEARGIIMKAVAAYEEILQGDQNFLNLKAKVRKMKTSKVAALRNKKITCVLQEIGSHTFFGMFGREPVSGDRALRAESFSMSFGQNHNTEGFELFLQGMLAAAKDEFQLAVDLDSKFSPGLNNLAVCRMQEGSLGEALKLLELAGENDIDSAVFYNNLGVLYYLRGNLHEGIKILEKAKELNPEATSTKLNLAGLSYLAGDIARALQLFKEIPEEDVLSDLAKRQLLYKVP